MSAPVLQVPASPAQQRLWSIEQDLPGTAQHTLFVEVVRRDTLDPETVVAALREVVSRHEALRTDFRVTSGHLHQIVREPRPVPVEFIDLTGLSEPEAGERYDELCRTAAGTPFDVSRAPLLRLQQVRRSSVDGEYDALLLAVHHLVADAISMEVIVGDLIRGVTSGSPAALAQATPPPLQYADFSQWHSERLAGAAAEGDRDFWRRHLADLEDLDLTLGRVRPPALSDRGAAVRIHLDEQQVAALTRLGTGQRATLFMVILGAYATALGEVFGARDVPVGMATSGRPVPEVARTVGLFTERLVVKVDLGGRPSFRQVLDRVRAEVLTVLEHDRLGYDGIVAAVAPSRRYGVAPLAQASINLHDSPVPEKAAGGVAAQSLGLARVETVRHDLALTLVRGGGALDGTLEYRSDVVAPEAAARVAVRFRAILDLAVSTPDLPLDAVPLLEAGEQRHLHRSQDGGKPFATGRSFPEMVAEQVRDRPEALAVDTPGRQLTYQELWEQAQHVARQLGRHGVRPGTEEPVLVAVPRSAALPVCLLGIHLAGAVYVPVDPAAPAPFLAELVEAVGARVALVTPDREVALPAGVHTLAVDVAQPAPAAGTDVMAWPTGSALAYVLFTSGTTGRPKAVAVEHRNLASYLGGLSHVLAPQPGAVHLMLQPPTFDSSLTMLAVALATGGVLQLVDQDTAVDPVALGDLLRERPIDYLKITPTHLSALLSGIDLEILRPRRALILGGEAAPRVLTDRLMAAGWRVIGHYGPTETTVGVLVHDLADLDPANPAESVPLGRPLPGTRVYVLDDVGRPVPPGRRGLLWVAGASVARGYLNNPSASADAFRPDPFGADPGARMYRTGDVVRRLPDGTFEFCGRGDRQLKIRGHRIEAAAVELAVGSVPGVTAVAVLARQERLVAYVVLAAPDPDPAGIRAHLAADQPGHLVPDVVIAVPALPRTASGKLDLAALLDAPAPEEEAEAFVPARTAAETIMAQLWCSVLGIDRVSVTSRFFDLGGDSIRAVYLAAGAASRGLRLSVKDIFDKQTLEAMAATTGVGGEASDGGPSAALAVLVRPAVVRIPQPPDQALPAENVSSTPPGLTVTRRDGLLDIAADPARCDDLRLGKAVAAWTNAVAPHRAPDPAADPASDRASGPGHRRLNPDTAAAFGTDVFAARRVHDAYATTPVDLAYAAVMRSLTTAGATTGADSPPSILVIGPRAVPPSAGIIAPQMPAPAVVTRAVPVVRPEQAGGDAGIAASVQSAKAALASADLITAWASPEDVPDIVLRVLPLEAGAALVDAGAALSPGRVVIVVAGADVIVQADPAARPGPGSADLVDLADRLARDLQRIVTHCRQAGPVYSPADFPDAGLDEDTLNRLLQRINPAAVAAPADAAPRSRP